MFWQPSKDRTGIALVAAFLLVLQTVVGALALGSSAGSAQLDAFGNPLCITSHADGADAAGSADPSNHGKLPGCCTLGCSMAAYAMGCAPHRISLSAPLAFILADLDRGTDASDAIRVERSPTEPRAPPLMG